MFSALLLGSLLATVSPGNILVFNPTMGFSHVKFIGNIADILARRGHNVTVWAPIFDRDVNPNGTTETNIRTIVQDIGHQVDFSKDRVSYYRPWSRSWKEEPFSFRTGNMDEFLYLLSCTQRMTEAILDDTEFLDQLREARFDLAITELFSYAPLGIFEVLGIRSVIVASSLNTFPAYYELTGLLRNPSFIPEMVVPYSEEMGFWQRLDSLAVHFLGSLVHLMDLYLNNQLLKTHYPGMPNLRELLHSRVVLVLTNVNEFTETPRFRTNMVLYIGGAGVYDPNPLDKKFEDLLNLREATVLFSLGTVIDSCTMSPGRVTDILGGLSTFPNITFLWKFPDCHNQTVSWDRSPNVVRLDWLPQADLLADPRVNAFITHGGMNSMNEAVFRGKPIIAVPLFADQFGNAQNAAKRGFGIVVSHRELSGESLGAALKQILPPSSSYTLKARRIAGVLQGQSEQSRREIVRHTELVLLYGPNVSEHRRLPTRHLNMLQLYSIDCILFTFCILCIFLLLVRRTWGRQEIPCKEKGQ